MRSFISNIGPLGARLSPAGLAWTIGRSGKPQAARRFSPVRAGAHGPALSPPGVFDIPSGI
ncbi:MAG TPA: hypothetical protein VL972_08355 [Solirubrobacteraceae bacterium]|nr:hypothetical protein [Solirubrobacteraceae bacterium]